MSKAVKWAMRYFSREVDVYDSLEEAVESAVWASEAGSEAMEFIEWEGKRITMGHPAFQAIERKIREEEEREEVQRRPATHVLEVKHPDGKWVSVYASSSADRLQESLEDYSAAVGAERVRVRPVE